MKTSTAIENATIQRRSSRSLDVILGLLPLILGLQLLVWIIYLPTALKGRADFRNCYSAGLIVRSGEGRELYNYELQRAIQNTTTASPSSKVLPYVHLPYEALLFVPFTLLSYRKAFLGFLCLNVVFLFLAYRLWHKRLHDFRMWPSCALFLFMGYAPISVTLLQGQDSILTLLLFSAALNLLDAKQDMIAGGLAGLAIYKLQLVLLIFVLFLLWRQWRFVAGLSLSASFLLIVSALITGPGRFMAYLISLSQISNTLSVGNTVLYVMPVSSMPNIRGTILALPHVPVGVKLANVAVLSLLVLATAFWAGAQKTSQWQLALAISATTLIGYHILMHDLSILLIPMATLLVANRGLWTVAFLWMSAPLCFFGYSPWVTLPNLCLFVMIVLIARKHGFDSETRSQDLKFAQVNPSQCC